MIRSAFKFSAEEEEVIHSINDYFDDLEYKVNASRISEIDKRIPFLIIRKFKQLFELWDENAAFSRYLEGDSFCEIFASLYNVFGYNYYKGSSGDCYLACELCGDEIVLRNNDPEYSYRMHETSKYHVEFVRDLEAIRTEKEVDLILCRNTNEEGTFLECHLCLVFIPIVVRDGNDESIDAHFTAAMDSHQRNVKHQMNMQIFNLNVNKSYIKAYDMEEKLFACSPCEQIYHVDLLMNHLRSSEHAESVNVKESAPKKNTAEAEQNAVSVVNDDRKADFDVFKTNMKLIRVIDDAIQCSLCESNLTSVNMVVEHLTSKKHTENLENYMTTEDVEKIDENEDFPQLDDRKCEQASVNGDVQQEEFPSKKAYQSRSFVFKSNYIVPICLLVVFSISMVLYQKS